MNNVELLAPGGDIESIKAAIVAGADAIYCGLDNFNARRRAENISFDNLVGIVRVAHEHDCQVFLTLNIIILEYEVDALIQLLNKLVNTDIDGVIVQDLGVFDLLSKHFPTLDIHASTQVTTHNSGQIHFLKKLGVSRVNLSRELNIEEIKHLTDVSHQVSIMTEVFVHGSNCIGFSGICYISSAYGGNSGNRGRCSQPCRDQYQTTESGSDYPLNLKDNSAFSDVAALCDANVDSLKIEGRIKKSHYVYTVVQAWRNQLDQYLSKGTAEADNIDLYKVFNRDFSNSYLSGKIGKNMFIDNPRDNSATHFTKIYGSQSEDAIKTVKKRLYDDKTEIIQTVTKNIEDLDIESQSLILTFSGQQDTPLTITMSVNGTEFVVETTPTLIHSNKYGMKPSELEKRFKSLGKNGYHIASYSFEALDSDLFVPFKHLSTLKDQLMVHLNGDKPLIPAVIKPELSVSPPTTRPATLSILLSNPKDVTLLSESDLDVQLYYQMPDCLHAELTNLVALFKEHPRLMPWFPSVLMEADFLAAASFLEQIRPTSLVTNNTGVAYTAQQLQLNWVAGPYLNLTNSLALNCLQNELGCQGAFLSNEINRTQLKQIKRPKGFDLHYSIYHPSLLLTSRQCLFQKTVGCKRTVFDLKCLRKCRKTTSIINMKGTSFVIDKQKGCHNGFYGQHDYLNLNIVRDMPNTFSNFLMDLRDIKTETKMTFDKIEWVTAFFNYLNQPDFSAENITQLMGQTMNVQYQKGL
jgi:putative protease